MIFRALSDLDLYFYTAGEIELHEGVDSLGSAAVDVDEALVAAYLELLAALLVDEGGAVDGDDLLVGGEGDRTADNSAGGLYALHDLLGGLLHESVVVALELDTNLLTHDF